MIHPLILGLTSLFTIIYEQSLSNLVSNAIKHHYRQDGRVIISAEEKDGFYQFGVTDDGQGIAPKDREEIFTIFQTLTSKDKQENTGIGLSIVKKIVEEQNGKIWVDSELGQGATFYFTWNI